MFIFTWSISGTLPRFPLSHPADGRGGIRRGQMSCENLICDCPLPGRETPSLRQLDRLELIEAVAGTGIVLRRLAAEMPDDPPDRVETGLHRALDPARRPGHTVARHEDALLVGRHVALHEVAIHAVVIAI